MKYMSFVSVALLLLTVSACEQFPAAGKSSGVAVIDLNAIAKATGRDEAINERMEAARVDLNAQLTQIAGDLENELKEQKDKVGTSPKPAEQQQLQEMAVQAQRQLAEKQQLAQQKAQQVQLELVNEFKRQVQPIAKNVANEQGANVVVVLDDAILWFDSSADITDEVIAELRANPLPPIQVKVDGSADTAGEESAPDAP